jgi:GNAT superfamily N-acetyltransferase
MNDAAAAKALLAAALPHDRIATVADEKLWGDNGVRAGVALGAWEGAELIGVMAAAGRWVKVLAVTASRQKRGVGTALLAEAKAGAQGKPLRVADHPGNYLSPGIDARYADAIAFFERRGFVRKGEVENLRATIAGNAQVTAENRDRLRATIERKGLRLARVAANELPTVSHFIEHTFAKVWAHEATRAANGPCRALHAIWRGDQPIAFAAADGNNQGLGWFGPAGTLEAERGQGLGEALLIACLVDVARTEEAGVIAWVGPKNFYARACGAVVDRTFVQLEEAS